MTLQLFTIGHSTLSADRFLWLLTQHDIRILADIRRFPGSRKFPQFNQSELVEALAKANIEYRWLQELGGRRPKQSGVTSNNLGLRNESFRNYADYMLTEEFRQGIAQLLEIAAQKPTAMMCSESVFWRCHRRLVADFLLTNEIPVQHIMPSGELRPHSLTEGAKIEDGVLCYPSPDDDQQQFLFS